MQDDRECETQTQKIKKGTQGLLAALREHHDFNFPIPLPKPQGSSQTKAIIDTVEAMLDTVKRAKDDDIKAAVAEFEKQLRELRIADIKRAVSVYFKLDPLVIESSRRTLDIVYPRQLAMWLCARFTRKSLPFIAKHFGDRDHTTVLHAIRSIQNKIEKGASVRINRVVRIIASDAADLEKICRGLI